jgi:methionyl-tRNA formyltransferase
VSRIVLLTQAECVPEVLPRLAASGAEVAVALTRGELEAALARGTQDVRVISFGSGVIVPPAILEALPAPAYNLHPGPPEYPGLFPSVYALYDGASSFGVTLHEMAAAVDAGPVVSVNRFPIPAGCDRARLDGLTFPEMLKLLERYARALGDVTATLPAQSGQWRGPLRTRADFAALCALPENADGDEFARRLRAVGEGPNHALTLTRFGRSFRLVSDARPVTRGGQPLM